MVPSKPSTVSEDNGAFYAGGYFTRAHSSERAWYAAKFSTQAGAAQDTSFDFQPSTVSAGKYQQTISSAGKRVFIGGSEHSLFGYDTGSNQRTSGSLMLSMGGDLQACNHLRQGRHLRLLPLLGRRLPGQVRLGSQR